MFSQASLLAFVLMSKKALCQIVLLHAVYDVIDRVKPRCVDLFMHVLSSMYQTFWFSTNNSFRPEIPTPHPTTTTHTRPQICSCNHNLVVMVKLIYKTDIVSIFCKIALRWMPQDLTVEWSISYQAMTWCHQCWQSFITPWHRWATVLFLTCLLGHQQAKWWI